MPGELTIQRNLTYVGVGTVLAGFINPFFFLPALGIFLGKGGRYIRREFDDEFRKAYPLEHDKKKSYLSRAWSATKNFFKGLFYGEHIQEEESQGEKSEDSDYVEITVRDSEGNITRQERVSGLESAAL